jgi:hypothetical protein
MSRIVELTKRRDEAVAQEYFGRERRLAAHGEHPCQVTVSTSAIASRFLQEGAGTIAREIQLEALTEDVLHFWSTRPRTRIECYANIRSVEDIIVDPWFVEECGRPSVTVLLRRVTIGDYVVMPDHAQIMPEDIDEVNRKAVHDEIWFEPCIRAYPSWVLEIMNVGHVNSHMLDTISPGLDSEEFEFRRCVGDGRSMCAALRRNGLRTNRYGRDRNCPMNPGWRTRVDGGGWSTFTTSSSITKEAGAKMSITGPRTPGEAVPTMEPSSPGLDSGLGRSPKSTWSWWPSIVIRSTSRLWRRRTRPRVCGYRTSLGQTTGALSKE